MLVTILLFKIKVVLCVITRHHHRHRFEKKIIRSEREVNAEIESFLRRRRKTTFVVGKNKHTSLLLVVVKTRVKEDINVRRQKERTHFFVPSAWLGARTAFQPTLRVFILFYRVVAVLVFLTCVLFLSFSLPFSKKNSQTLNNVFFLLLPQNFFSFPLFS